MGTRTTLVVAVVSACSASSIPIDPTPPPPPPPSDNPIDVAIWPRLIEEGFTDLTPATTNELCRRISLDLTGVSPQADEVATLCTGKSPEQIVRGFMALPRFRDTERRFWIRRIGAEPTALMADHIADADRIYLAAADGTIGYDDMVAQLVAHPIITLHRSIAEADDVAPTVLHVFNTFLGRAPSAIEIDDFANLLRPWQRRFEDRYDLGYSYYVRPAALDPRACLDAVLGASACTSTLLGAPTTVDLQITPRVPSGYSQTSDNLYYYELAQGDMPAALQAELEKPGRLLATRAELWDEAADVALSRFVGWWRSTPNEPDSVLPEVQQALGSWFRGHETRDLRELYVVVMTSLLYTSSSEVVTDGERPPWTTGPTKLLEPEQLLDSVARALGRELGQCDPHTEEEVGLDFYWPDRLRTSQPSGWYGFGYDFYRQSAVMLGGCLGARQAPRNPGLPALLTHIELARGLCAPPSELLPAGIDAAAPATVAVATDLFTRFLARAPASDEVAMLDAAAAACLGDSGCATAKNLAIEVCGALLRSSAFLYY
ncbi:MAG: DUF1549 domain-containing protein [Deltaproteobacteria bacterium]|nr:DUF1549 domain-containing protein [Deltaproteobacteria bacterium]